MTIKEALEQIKKSHSIAMAMLIDGKRDEKTEQAINIIEQDLEVLEIIKRHKTTLTATNENGEIVFTDYSFPINHDDEDYKKVKRWLEENEDD